jgi:hypothetical protein
VHRWRVVRWRVVRWRVVRWRVVRWRLLCGCGRARSDWFDSFQLFWFRNRLRGHDGLVTPCNLWIDRSLLRLCEDTRLEDLSGVFTTQAMQQLNAIAVAFFSGIRSVRNQLWKGTLDTVETGGSGIGCECKLHTQQSIMIFFVLLMKRQSKRHKRLGRHRMS